MPSVRIAQTIAANTTVANLLAGSQFEFMQVPTAIDVAGVADTATGTVQVEVMFGQEVELAPAVLGLATAGEGPRIPDDNLVSDVAAPGDRIIIRATETGGVNTPIRMQVRMVPLR